MIAHVGSYMLGVNKVIKHHCLSTFNLQNHVALVYYVPICAKFGCVYVNAYENFHVFRVYRTANYLM